MHYFVPVLSALAAGLVFVSGASVGEEKEEKIALDKLPAKVKEALKARYPDGKLLSAEKEEENKKIHYEVVVEDKGAKLEVVLKEDGTIVAVEKAIAIKDLPREVTEAPEAKYPKAVFKKAEEIDKDEKTSYEVLLVTAQKKTYEVVLDPKILETEEKKPKEKKD